MKKLYYLLVLIPVIALGQSNNQNWVKSKTYKESTLLYPSPTALQTLTQVSYFDGFGRPIQQVAHAQSNSGKDIVTHIEYDAFGRQTKEFLPYVNQSASLNYNSSAETDVLSFYNTIAYESTPNPFSEKQFEASPLNRVQKQAAPGLAWGLPQTTGVSNDRSIKLDYQANTSTDAVKLFVITSEWDTTDELYKIPILLTPLNYSGSDPQLYKTITKNENWISTNNNNNTTQEFKNKEGQVVLKRAFNNNIAHDTYYVYDQFGNLTFVIPPAVDATASITQLILNNMCYQYKYDSRNRLVEKKLPGKQWEYIVYDKLDRVVATGPAYNPYGGSETNKGWMITKYDVFNRPAYTAWYSAAVSNSTDRKVLQRTYNLATVFSENKTTSVTTINGIATKYSNLVTPNTFILLTVNYYDNYDYPDAPVVPANLPDSTFDIATNVKGMSTGSWVRVLDVAGSTANELSYTIYDNKFRPVRTYSKNYLGGYTQVDSKIDWAGKTEYTLTKHKFISNSKELSIKDTFEYTQQDRLTKHKHQIFSSPEQLISFNTYDDLGQLINKKVGGTDVTATTSLQKIDYSYNIRGWLKEINKISVLNSQNTDNDLFSFKINYNDYSAIGLGDTAPTALFNGNISATYWQTSSDNKIRKYNYVYDDLNRLLRAHYNKPKSQTTTDNYLEKLSYDKNGNIITLERNGDFDNDGVAPVPQIDDLVYTYDIDNKNQLKKVLDNNTSPQGFIDGNLTGDDYDYDLNGNMTIDKNKGITAIKYNHLNLPTKINFGTINTIDYIYNALGQKVLKKVKIGSTITNTNYISGFMYENNKLIFFPHAEGYVKCTPTNLNGFYYYNYVFNYTDHLGNVRLSYGLDENLEVKILEENHYYPFGLKHSYYNEEQLEYISEVPSHPPPLQPTNNSKYNYKFSGKELQEELGLNMYDFGARNYDPALGRWMNIDPLAETSRRWSPYTYAYNNPLRFVDPDGMQNEDWVKWRTASGDLNVTYDVEIKTQKEAEDKGYTGVEEVFKSGTIQGTAPNDGAEYSYALNEGGTITNVGEGGVSVESGFATPMGTYVGENKTTLSQLGSAFQDIGDGLTLAGAALSATGFGAVVGGPMMAIGGGFSLTGTAMELTDNYYTGTLTTEKVLTKVAMEAIPYGGGKVFKALGAPAANTAVDVYTIGVDRSLDALRDAKAGPYRK